MTQPTSANRLITNNRVLSFFGTSSTQRRVLLRLRIVLVIILILSSLFVYINRQNNATNTFARFTDGALSALENQITSHLSDPITTISRLANSTTNRLYAQGLVRITTTAQFNATMNQLQTDMLRSFDDIVGLRRNLYNGARYILRDGRVWGEVINFPNETRISAEVSRTLPSDDTLLVALLSRAQAGVPFLSLERVVVGDEIQNILKINVPVTTLGNNANILGFAQLELRLDVLNSAINDVMNDPLVRQDGRQVILVDSQNQIIATSENFSLDAEQINAFLDRNRGDLLLADLGETGYVASAVSVGNYVGINADWRIIILDNWNAVITPTNVSSLGIIAAIVVLMVLFIIFVRVIFEPVLSPLDIINGSLQRLVRDNQHIALESRFTTEMSIQPDEVAQILNSIDYLGRSLKQMGETVNEQFKRRNRELEVATRIGREVANLYDIDLLVNRAINLICSEFGFYHAQVFLVDDARMNAVLRYSHGKSGEKLLAQNFKIPIGSESVIGTVTSKGHAVIVNDTQWRDKSAPYAQNPVLNETRAELGLPLRSGGQVIGVLDIQSRTTNAFKEDDLPVYSLLADQLAVAITTARILTQNEKRIQQIDSLNKQLTRIAWESAEQRIQLDSSYVYNLVDVAPKDPLHPTENAIQTPIVIRGENIGQMIAMPDTNQELSEGDRVILQAVASRVAMAIENARLFQETQNSLAETSTLYQLSQYLNEADTLDEILQSIIISMTSDASGGQIWMFSEAEVEENSTPIWGQLISDYTIRPREAGDENLIGLRLRLTDHAFLREVQPDRIALINNAQEDARVDRLLLTVLERLNAMALVLIPLSVRGIWRGFITIAFAEPRQFSDREGRIFSALSDQAGVAIDNRLLLRQTEEEVARNENLYAASRIINTSQTSKDLVYAAVATNTDPHLNFALSLLEGELDATGWPSQARMVARSEHGGTHEIDVVYPIFITPDSPMRNRNPEIIVDEAPNDPNAPNPVKWIRAQGYRFMAIFPLFSANQPIALFHITSNQLHELQADEYEVYRAMTGQMSSQIQIRRLLQTAQSALDETSRLYVASRAITTAQDFEELYTAAIEHLARPFLLKDVDSKTSSALGIALFLAWPYPTPNAPYLEVAYEWHNNPNVPKQFVQGERVPADDYPYGRLTEGRDATVVFDNIIQADDPILREEPVLRTRLLESGIWSLALAPIRSRVKWFGVIACQHERPRAFNEQYARFMMALADQIAIALDNLRLVEEARFEASRAQIEAQRALALAEAAQLANRIAGDDIAVGMDEIFARVAEETNFDRWLLMRVSETDPDMLETLVGKIPNFDDVVDGLQYNLYFELPMIDSLRRGSTLLINDPTNYPSVAMMDDAIKDGIIAFFGKHIATPVTLGGLRYGVIMMGRDLNADDLDARDQQLVETLATQVSIALENRRLFRQTQQEQQNLKSILETLPAGVLVLDPKTLMPIQFNEQAQAYLGQEIDPLSPFSIEKYNLYRTGTQLPYPQEEMPIFLALMTGEESASDDVAVIVDTIQIDLLVNAAPIKDEHGNIQQIVVALQDITSLRMLENTLQENLRETVSLYEAQRQLAEAVGLNDVLDVVITHIGLQQPLDAYILVRDIHQKPTIIRSHTQLMDSADALIPILSDTEVILVESVEESRYVPEMSKKLLTESGIYALITMPIRVSTSDKPYGWIVIVEGEAYTLGLDEERIFVQMRDVSATAIDNRLLLESQAATVREVRLLYNATNNIARSRDVAQLVSVLEESITTFNADYAFGYLDPAFGLVLEGGVLFDMPKPDMPSVDFISIFEDYDVPPGGVYINDIEEVIDRLPTEQALLDAGIYAFAAIHLRPKDVNSGFIVVAYRDIHNFTESEDRYLNTLADGSSVLLNTFTLIDQIQSSLEETSTLYQASRNLSNASDVDEILDVLVNYLIAPHINQVFIALLDENNSWQTPGAKARVVASWDNGTGLDMMNLEIKPDTFPAWGLLSSSTLVTIDDVDTHTYDTNPEAQVGLEAMGLRSLIVAPLRVPKRAIGAVWLGSTEPHLHNDREIRTYQAFAEQASLSMEAAYLLGQTEKRALQLETTAEVSRNAAQILDLDELLPKLVDLIRDSFGYDHVQIFLMDDKDEYAVLKASTGEAGRQLLGVNHKLPKASLSVIGQVTALGEPQIAGDTADSKAVHRSNPFLPLTRSEMALPLIIKGKVVGALDVQSNTTNAFNEEDVKALTTLAAQISVAIDNAGLYKTAQQQAESMSFLFNITATAVSADTVEQSLFNVAEQLYESLQSSAIVVYTPVTYEDTLNKQNSYQTLKAVALVGSESPLDELEEVRLGDPDRLISIVASNRQPFILNTFKDETRYIPVYEDTQSLAIVPLVFSNQLVGMIILEDSRENAFGYETLQLLLTMAGSLSAVVQSAQLRDELQLSNQQLMELDRLKSDFLANMSHELRTPLNSIIGFSRVMLKGIDGPLTEMQEQDLSTIYNSGQHLLYLINEILDQAKIAAEKLDLKFGYFEVKPVVEGVKSIGIGLVKDKNLDLMVEIANNLPKAYGDEFRTRQILLNLVSNAAKFTHQGGITIRVYPVTNHDGKMMVKIDVTDTGIGISEQDLPLIFQPFRQVDSSLTRTQGGTGLGLPIAKSLTELQGGEMTATSVEHRGSTFSITLPTEPTMDIEAGEKPQSQVAPKTGPLSKDKEPETKSMPIAKVEKSDTKPNRETSTTEVTAIKANAPMPKVMQAKRQILLIEDNKDMVDQFRRTLQREGFEVIVADHPAYAEAMVSNLRPTLIIMDVNFAGGEGWTVLTSLKDRDDTFDIPIIVVTLSNDSQRAYQLGAHSFIQRPYMPDELIKAVLKAEIESNTERILIIDDDPDSIRLLTQLLNENGSYRVFYAENGTDGISMVARRRPDLIILDLRMPGKDGFAVLEELRSNPETVNIPVIVVTGELNLNSDEQTLLSNIHILYKSDISQAEYDRFIQEVRRHLDTGGTD